VRLTHVLEARDASSLPTTGPLGAFGGNFLKQLPSIKQCPFQHLCTVAISLASGGRQGGVACDSIADRTQSPSDKVRGVPPYLLWWGALPAPRGLFHHPSHAKRLNIQGREKRRERSLLRILRKVSLGEGLTHLPALSSPQSIAFIQSYWSTVKSPTYPTCVPITS